MQGSVRALKLSYTITIVHEIKTVIHKIHIGLHNAHKTYTHPKLTEEENDFKKFC